MFKFFKKFSSSFFKKYFQPEIFLKGWGTPLKSSPQQHKVSTNRKGFFNLSPASSQRYRECLQGIFSTPLVLCLPSSASAKNKKETEKKVADCNDTLVLILKTKPVLQSHWSKILHLLYYFKIFLWVKIKNQIYILLLQFCQFLQCFQ